MKRTLLLVIALTLPPLGLRAETAGGDVDKGFSLLEEGARIILRSMIDEMKPGLDEARKGLGQAMAEWEPALREMADRLGDLSAYEPPVVLPNGDILIRRKREPFGPPMPGQPVPGGEIEL